MSGGACAPHDSTACSTHLPVERRSGRRRRDRRVRRARSRCPSRRGRCSRRRSRTPPRAGRSCSRCRPASRPNGIAGDLRQYLGDDAVELFPAWETLPFERVSPATETMGRRLRVIWRLRTGGDHLPAVIVAPVRALVQRLGPHVEDVEPIVVAPGRAARPRRARRAARRDGLPARVPGRGARRGRGARLDRRRVSRRPPTIRCASTSGATRSTGSRSSRWPTSARTATLADDVDLPGARAAADRRRARPRRRAAARRNRGAASSGSGSPKAQTFDGMESWLPWLTADEHLLPDLLPGERARRARRAAPPARPRPGAARRGSRARARRSRRRGVRRSTPTTRRACRCRSTGCSRTRKAQTVPVLAAPDHPDTPVLAASAFDPVVGDADGLGAAPQRAASRRLPRVRRGRGHAARRARDRARCSSPRSARAGPT